MERIRKEKGITLIALVITIILLLILTGVVVKTITGENGLIKHTQVAKEKYEIEEAKEQINIVIVGLEMEKIAKNQQGPTIEEILDKLYKDKIIKGDYGIDEKGQKVEVITEKGYIIEISKDENGKYNVEEKGKIKEDIEKAKEPIVELSLASYEENQQEVTILVKAKEEQYGIKKIQLIDAKTGKITQTKTYEEGTKQVENVEFTVSENGVYKIKVISNAPKEKTEEIEITQIVETLEIEIEANTNEWTNQNIKLNIKWPKEAQNAEKTVSIGEESFKPYTGKEEVEKNANVYAKAKLETGKTITGSIEITNIDKLPPKQFKQTVVTGLGTITVRGETTDQEATTENGKSGIDRYIYKLDENEWVTNKEGTYTFENVEEGIHKITMKAVDKAGNEQEATNKDEEIQVKGFESYENEIKIKIDPIEYSKTKTVTVEWPDVTGTTKQISTDGGQTYVPYTQEITIEKNCIIYAQMVYGEKTITANLEVTTIDNEQPQIISQNLDEENFKLKIQIKDEKSGLESVKIEKQTSTTETSSINTTTVLEKTYNGEKEEQTIEEKLSVPYSQYLRGYKIIILDKAGNINTYIENNLSIQNNKYIITTKEELQDFATAVNSGSTFAGITVELGADIDIGSINNWTPIGDTGSFRGTFNGHGYTISNMKITSRSKDNTGLFGSVVGGTIKDVKLKDYRITCSGNNTGGLVRIY